MKEPALHVYNVLNIGVDFHFYFWLTTGNDYRCCRSYTPTYSAACLSWNCTWLLHPAKCQILHLEMTNFKVGKNSVEITLNPSYCFLQPLLSKLTITTVESDTPLLAFCTQSNKLFHAIHVWYHRIGMNVNEMIHSWAKNSSERRFPTAAFSF